MSFSSGNLGGQNSSPYGQSFGGDLASIFGGFGNLMNFKNPADSAMPYLNQISGAVKGYMDPYINAGTSALNSAQGQYSQLINDPAAKMAQFGSSFQQSPGFQWQVGQATNAANRAAQAGGMVGSPMEQQQLATTVNGLANQDYYNYLSKVMGLYGQGLGGMQNIAGMGLQAGTTASNDLMQQLLAQAQLSYAGQNAVNMNRGGSWGDILGGLGGMLGNGGGLSGIATGIGSLFL